LSKCWSTSTKEYDRGDKFEHYKRIASLRQYVLVSHLEREMEVWFRTAENEWASVVERGGGRVFLDSIGAELPVDEVYDAAAEPQ
jgi:Uma2 family endonuclease